MSLFTKIVLDKVNSTDMNFLHFHHYTSLEGLKGIWDSNSIWASNIKFLNDSSEYSYSSNVLKDILKERNDKESILKDYVKHFSEDKDDSYNFRVQP